jgi:1-acyl-sn-glycerol-3-phosphate acyltransferase
MRLLPAPVLAVLNLLLLVLNTVFWALPILVAAVIKLLLPLAAVRRPLDHMANAMATNWISCNGVWIAASSASAWDVQGLEGLRPGGWYLVNCNHRSWVDIFVLQRIFNRRIPFLKFFLKQQLIWVPVIGLVWWALDFPFMKRHSLAALKKHPELRLQDLETTRRACARFALVPTSVMNFAEGTRFTPAKHAAQQSPHRHLLKPKAGALALALNVMGEQFRALVDVTLVYPDGTPSFVDLIGGRCGRVLVRVQERVIPTDLLGGDYSGDAAYRARFQQWLGALWQDKDALIEQLLEPSGGHKKAGL